MSVIYLLPLGSADRTLVLDLRSPLMETFGSTVALEEIALDLEQFLDERRLQYNSTRILLDLQQNHPAAGGDPRKGGDMVLAVTAEDLFVPILTFVFGEAQLGGAMAVVSYHRLQPELYGLPPDPALLYRRLVKESVHELGHTRGLIHCGQQECVMHTSTDVEEIDLKGSTFCAECSAELLSMS